MKIAVSGASGKTGYRICEGLLKNDHEVRLLVRPSSLIPESLSKCEVNKVSLEKKSHLENSLEGIDTLIIATGARPSIDLTGPARIDALGVSRQVECCKKVGVKRIILVSSLCAGKLIHPLNLFGLILIFKRIGEQAVEDSGLEWTIIRPGGLNEKEENLKEENILYTNKNQQEEGSIPRRLVAKVCIDSLSVKESIGKIIEITSNKEQKQITLKKAIEGFNI